jgi:ribonuclease H / adenosylcobalamin/alpha-ribazole phosphatase
MTCVSAQIVLIRHAAHAHLGTVLSGRLPALALSEQGRAQAEALSRHLASARLAALHASPVERAQETAAAIAARHPGLTVETQPPLNEVDFGDWQGQSFSELAADPRWDAWNAERGVAAAPGGETMAAAQERAWDHVERTALSNPGAVVAMVSHCDVIRAVVAHVLGLPLDRLLAFEVDPASLTRLEVGAWGARLLSLNQTCAGTAGG